MATRDLAVASGAEPLFQATNLCKDFASGWFGRKSSNFAVSDADLVLEKGRTLALVGESGSGKTTTARMIAGLTQPTSGAVLFEGKPVRDGSGRLRRDYHRLVQFVYQNPFSSLDPRWRIEDIIRDPLKVNGVGDAASQKRRVAELAEAMALPAGLLVRRAAELSGGQLQRVAIARALSLEPKLLVLDEPTSALDVSVQAKILALLQAVQRERNIAFLFVSHDLAVVNALAHSVAVMKDGRIVEAGSRDRVLGNPRQSYTRELIDAVPGRRLPEPVSVSSQASAAAVPLHS